MSSKKKSKDSFIKSSRFGRLYTVAQSVAKGAAEIGIEKLKEKTGIIASTASLVQGLDGQIKVAKDMVKTMGELKGALMKIGQMLSITEDLILPPEITEVFQNLQTNSKSMDKELIYEIIKENFGQYPDELFLYFDSNPVAQASIGQVHKAQLKTKEHVAVKVQYPSIVEAIKSDLKNLDQIGKFFSLFLPGDPDLTPFLLEIKRTLLDECDYRQELKNIKKFRAVYKKFDFVYVPKPFSKYSSEEVLTTEFMTGDRFEYVLKHYSRREQNQLGETLYNLFLHGLFQAQLLHTDPQNGNYLFQPGKVIILDFGSIRYFSNEFVEDYAMLFRALEDNNLALYERAGKNLCLFDKDAPIEEAKKHYDLFGNIYRPFNKVGTFYPGDINPFQLAKDYFKKANLKRKELPREEFILLDRVNLGLFSKLKSLQAEVNWRAGIEKHRYPVDARAFERYFPQN